MSDRTTKRIIVVLLALFLAPAFAGCFGEEKKPEAGKDGGKAILPGTPTDPGKDGEPLPSGYTNSADPKAHIHHVHRPPRVPEDRVPHCRWEITIDEDNETLPEADITTMTRRTTAATFEFPPMRDGTPHLPPTATEVSIG